jgi:hypothetical protein
VAVLALELRLVPKELHLRDVEARLVGRGIVDGVLRGVLRAALAVLAVLVVLALLVVLAVLVDRADLV